jgi:hypothetical protein
MYATNGQVFDENGRRIAVYEQLKKYGPNTTYEPPRSAGEEIDTKVRKLRAQHPKLSYTEAYHSVLEDPDNSELKLAFARELYR